MTAFARCRAAVPALHNDEKGVSEAATRLLTNPLAIPCLAPTRDSLSHAATHARTRFKPDTISSGNAYGT